jgi:acetyltransferase
MSIYHLDKIFNPESVAVIGASDKIGSIGHAVLRNLREGGCAAPVFAVNIKQRSVMGESAYPSVLDIPQSIDLAVIATPLPTVPDIIKECVAAGVGGAIVISAGGKEIGAEGRLLETRIRQAAERGSLRIVGPNCLGVICTGSRLNASFANHMALPGKLAFVSQSGAICTAVLDLALKQKIGFSHFLSIGSMLDVDFGDLINYLGDDPAVQSIVLYVESLSNVRKFMSAARAVSRIKPIVVLKSGRSPAGARAAASHTGALAGEDAVHDAAFKRAGIVRINTIAELFDCAELMAKQPRPPGSGLAVITNAGGPGVMAVDALVMQGLEPVPLTTETLKALDGILPRHWSHGNPIDILGDASPERYREVLKVCLTAPEIQALLVMLTPQSMTDPTGVAMALVEVLREKPVSIFTVWMGGGDVEAGRTLFNASGIPTYETPERAVTAFVSMVSYQRNLELLQQVPPKLPRALAFDRATVERMVSEALQRGERFLPEFESKALLAAYGIPVNRGEVARSPEEAVHLAAKIGYPLAMKIYSPDVVHKSDVDGIRLNLSHAGDVRMAFESIMASVRTHNPGARLPGVTLQPMLKPPDYELILGSKRDSHFGPVILFGMGGIMAEILRDHAIALPPLNRLLARRLIESTRVSQLLRGYRNRPAANLEVLEEILLRLSQLVTDIPEIAELDINPLFLTEDKACAVDARVILEPSELPSPLHLVISPYPNQYEAEVVTTGGLKVLIRPIKPEDAPLLVDLFQTLSFRSIYQRFFSPLKSLSREMLARFTQIDYDRDVALVAMEESEGGEKMLGVARLISDPDCTRAEFAVLVGDPWQGQGVGAELMQRLIAVARERRFAFLTGAALAENTTMLTLARKLGFTVTAGAGAGDYQMSINLNETGNEG